MPNATPRANALALPERTDRRALLGVALAAGAAAALPAAALSPALSPLDQHILKLWSKQKEIVRIVESGRLSPTECEQADDHYCALVRQLDEKIDKSPMALGAILLLAIEDGSDEAVFGLHRAALRTIRSHLRGAIANDADRVLAQHGEAA